MGDENELETWRNVWRATNETPQGHASSLPPAPSQRTAGGGWRLRLFGIMMIFVGGLSFLAYWPEKVDRNQALSILVIVFSLGAFYVGGSRSGPGSVLLSPDSYLRSRGRTKAKEMRRVRWAQWIAIAGVAITTLVLWARIRGEVLESGMQGRIWLFAALTVGMTTCGALEKIQARRSQELESLREMEAQFDEVDSAIGEEGENLSAIANQPARDSSGALGIRRLQGRFKTRKKI